MDRTDYHIVRSDYFSIEVNTKFKQKKPLHCREWFYLYILM
ncbi:hypothetical protein J2X61_001174 [Bacillus sp. 3255]|nr:hypothetical protein [Bacillus sp. 3255]